MALQTKVDLVPASYFKGQLISKGLFGTLNSPNFLDFTSITPQVDLFSFFLGEKTFRN